MHEKDCTDDNHKGKEKIIKIEKNNSLNETFLGDLYN
jgi:hypothetical protein